MFVNENALDWSAIRAHSNDGVVGDVFVSPVDDDVFVSPENEDIVDCLGCFQKNDKNRFFTKSIKLALLPYIP